MGVTLGVTALTLRDGVPKGEGEEEGFAPLVPLLKGVVVGVRVSAEGLGVREARWGVRVREAHTLVGEREDFAEAEGVRLPLPTPEEAVPTLDAV